MCDIEYYYSLENTLNILVEKMVLIIEKINILEDKIDQINTPIINLQKDTDNYFNNHIYYNNIDWNSVHLY
jgi:hypothetical protein